MGVNSRKLHTTPLVNPGVLIGAAFVCHFLVLGVAYSFGVYYIHFLEVFGYNSAATAWVGSLNFATLCATGPLASYLMERLTVRWTVVLGGLVSFAGVMASAFAPNIYTLFIAFGLISGIGFGLVFTASVVVISVNFDKYRTVAMGIAISGSGFGTFCYPLLANWLISLLGWRGAMMVTSGIILNVCAAGALMRSKDLIPKKNKTQRRKNDRNFNVLENGDRKAPPMDYLEDERDTFLHPNATHQSMEFKDHHSNLKKGSKSLLSLDRLEPLLLKAKSVSILSLMEPKINPADSFRYYQYWLLHISTILFCFGMSVVYTHICAYAASTGLPDNMATSLVSACGLTNLAGRVLLGLLAQRKSVSTLFLYVISYVIAGGGTMLVTFWKTYIGQMVGVSIFGFFSAAFGPLLTEVTCTVVGVTNFSYGYGFLMISMAIGTLLGAPSAGWLYDWSMTYANSFYMGGAVIVMAGVTMVPPWAMDLGGNRNEDTAHAHNNIPNIIVQVEIAEADDIPKTSV